MGKSFCMEAVPTRNFFEIFSNFIRDFKEADSALQKRLKQKKKSELKNNELNNSKNSGTTEQVKDKENTSNSAANMAQSPSRNSGIRKSLTPSKKILTPSKQNGTPSKQEKAKEAVRIMESVRKARNARMAR